MTITLTKLAAGDTNYISKHNTNLDAISDELLRLDDLVGNAAAASDINVIGAFKSLFGETASLIGSTSYLVSEAGTSINVQPGYMWRPSTKSVVSWNAVKNLSFVGVSSGLWYIAPSTTGEPTRVATSTESAYRVYWNGSVISAITRMLPIVWGAADDIAAQVSAALAASYDTLDSRLEAGETKAVAGDLARTYQVSRLSKSLAGSSNVALTSTEANNLELHFTGSVTANIDVTISLASAPKAWVVVNDSTGGFKVTLKGSAGTGVALPFGQAIWVYSDGTNIKTLPKQLVMTKTYAASVTVDFSLADTIKMTLSGNPTITLAGGVDKQKYILELTQDATGSRTITLINHRFGSDITSITLSTAANLTDKIGFIYDAAEDKYDVVAILRGF